MNDQKFKDVAANDNDPRWSKLIERIDPLYTRIDDPRSTFSRDYNRILHCTAYRRLKHRPNVFFATGNDHICTRIEHVNHVMAISHTISEG
jgi:dGTPase